MNTGQLTRRIQIQAQGPVELDQFRQPTAASWQTIYSCWANIDIQASQQIYSTAEFIAETTYRITTRWTSSVIFTNAQRIVYTEPTTKVVHTYQIKTVENIKTANKWLTLLCYEIDGKE